MTASNSKTTAMGLERMKIAFDSTYHWDFSAPILDAEVYHGDADESRLRVWCDHCQRWHYHGRDQGIERPTVMTRNHLL